MGGVSDPVEARLHCAPTCSRAPATRRSRYAELDLPVLIVWGQDDTWIPVDRAHRLAELIRGSRLELIVGSCATTGITCRASRE
jgi:pimeloyl-ACP methyl ester carboxylesterase